MTRSGRRAPAVLAALLLALPSLRAETSLDTVWESLRLGRWDDAKRAIEGLKKSEPSIASQAWYAEGVCLEYRRPGPDAAAAAAAYSRVLQDFPASSTAPWALLALARQPDLAVLHPDPSAAIPLYQRVLAEYPASDAAQEAALYLAEARWRAGGPEGARQAVHELEGWQGTHPSKRYAALVELTLGKLYRYPLGDYRKAVEHSAAALDLGLRSLPQRTAACWTVASLAETQLGDRDLAVQYYSRFLKEFPRHKNAFMAKLALQRLGAPLPPEYTPLEGPDAP